MLVKRNVPKAVQSPSSSQTTLVMTSGVGSRIKSDRFPPYSLLTHKNINYGILIFVFKVIFWSTGTLLSSAAIKWFPIWSGRPIMILHWLLRCWKNVVPQLLEIYCRAYDIAKCVTRLMFRTSIAHPTRTWKKHPMVFKQLLDCKCRKLSTFGRAKTEYPICFMQFPSCITRYFVVFLR